MAVAAKSNKQLDMFPDSVPAVPSVSATEISVLKSAIQKAYRRNHRELFDFSFNHIWAVDPKWIIWRTPIFAAEEGWQTLTEIGRVVRQLESSTTTKNPTAWANAREVLHSQLVMQMAKEKNKDGDGMRIIAEITATKEGRARAKLLEAVEKKVKPESFKSLTTMVSVEEFAAKERHVRQEEWAAIWDRVNSLGERCLELGKTAEDYQNLRDQVGAAYFRGKKGGMVGDRTLLVSVALLSMDDYEFKTYGGYTDLPATALELREDAFLGEAGQLIPWHCCDGHTGIGKRLVAYLMKCYPYSKLAIQYPAFMYESARVNATHCSSIWWGIAKRVVPISFGYDVDVWEQEIWPEMREKWKKKVVQWQDEERG